MTREEFMREARETAQKILAGKENGIMNLVQYAWAEGKRNAEVETITEILRQAYDQVKQKDGKDCRDCSQWATCPCGKPGHDKGASIGYSIGECKDYEPKES